MMSTPPSSPPTRRRVLQTLAGAGGLVAAGLLPTAGASSARPAASPAALLNSLASAAALHVTFTHAALSGPSVVAPSVVAADPASATVRRMLSEQQQALDALYALGGRPGRVYAVPASLCSDARVFVQGGLHLAQALTDVYVGAAAQAATLGQPALAAQAARLATLSARHHAQLSQLSGLDAALLPGVGYDLAVYMTTGQAGMVQARLPGRAQVAGVVAGA